jgi:hypothetical protein
MGNKKRAFGHGNFRTLFIICYLRHHRREMAGKTVLYHVYWRKTFLSIMDGSPM